MNYYKFNIGDYAAVTRHLSMLEHGAYRLLLDLYYTTEQPIPADIKEAARKAGARAKDEIKAVELVLGEFFTLSATGWVHSRCEQEIAEYMEGSEERAKREANEKDRMRRHRDRRAEMFEALRLVGIVPPWDIAMKDLQRLYNDSRNAPETHLQRVAGRSTETLATAITTNHKPLTTNHKPITINQEPETNTGKPTLVAEDVSGLNTHSAGVCVDPPDSRDSPNPPQSPATAAGQACLAMRAAGIADTNPGHPKLAALLAAGATAEELGHAARAAVDRGKGFAYALGTVERQRADAAAMAPGLHTGPLPSKADALRARNHAAMDEWLSTAEGG